MQSKHQDETDRIIKRCPRLIRSSFRYDQQRKCWMAASWTQPGEHEVHWLLSGTVLLTTCDCQGAAHGTRCAHERGFAAVLFPEIHPGVVVTEHVSSGNGPLDIGKAAPARAAA